MVLAGDLTVGALIAIMALIWRVLSPLQSAFMSLNRLSQTVQSIRQINRMMQIPIERTPGRLPTIFREIKGRIDVAQVSYRYGPRGEPVLRNASLSVQPGEIVAVTGGSGAGKSTLLKIIAGLYKPQGGVVFVDGLDLRQINLGELRAQIGFAPQFHHFFYGTLLQNIQLAHPTATRADVIRLLGEFGADEWLANLPDGLDTRLNGDALAGLGESFRQQLSLARAFIKDAPIHLLDEPGRNLTHAADLALIDYLRGLRGRSTVVMVTHRPSHMRLADRLVVMRQGQVVADGNPEEILDAMAAA
jgi:ABC-type multidrug transport system fused ATPase/permease subunit